MAVRRAVIRLFGIGKSNILQQVDFHFRVFIWLKLKKKLYEEETIQLDL